MTWWDMARHEYDTRWLDQTRSGLKLLKWHDLTWSDIKLSWFDFIWPDMAWHKMIRTNHDMAWYEITCSVMASRDVTRHEITRRDTTQRDTRYDRITWCAILIIFHVLSEPIKSIFFFSSGPSKRFVFQTELSRKNLSCSTDFHFKTWLIIAVAT